MTVHDNTISGNAQGIYIVNDPLDLAVGNVITANRVGTDRDGLIAIANGVGINDGGTNTQIGGEAIGEGNVVSGNEFDGIIGGVTTGTQVVGNLIGTDINGTGVLANGGGGIAGGGSNGAVVERNIVAGNGTAGIGISANDTLVTSNLIGASVDAEPYSIGPVCHDRNDRNRTIHVHRIMVTVHGLRP